MDVLTLSMINNLKNSGGVGYTEGSKTEILPEQTIPINEELGGYALDFIPVAHKVYTVVVDGVEYKCEAKSATMQGMDLVVLGNAVLYGVPGNGEPWYIAYISAYQMCAFGWMNESNPDPTIAIYEGAETIKPIDQKYLPDMSGGLPHVELSFDGDSFTKKPVGWHYLTQESSDMVGEIAKSRPPAFLATLPYPGQKITVLFTYTDDKPSAFDGTVNPYYTGHRMWEVGTHSFCDLAYSPTGFDPIWEMEYKAFTYQSAT